MENAYELTCKGISQLVMSGELAISSFLSHHINLKRQTDQHYSPLTGQCYSSVSLRKERKIHPKDRNRRGALAQFWLLFSDVFPPPPGPALCKLCQPGVLFALPEVLTLVLGPSFVLFSQAFPFPVFQPPPFWAPFSYSNYLTVIWV